MHTLRNLPASAALEVFASLCSLLPPPVTDTPEARAKRDETAMDAVAALSPTDTFEALLAARIVGAEAHARDCLRLAVQPGQTPEETVRHRAQACAMMRQAESSLRTLLRMQAAREKAELAMHPAAMERAGYWFRDASVPDPTLTPPEPAPAKPEFSALTEAEQYAVIYPARAASIRAARGLPPRCDFGPPEPELVEALVTGTSPILTALDDESPSLRNHLAKRYNETQSPPFGNNPAHAPAWIAPASRC